MAGHENFAFMRKLISSVKSHEKWILDLGKKVVLKFPKTKTDSGLPIQALKTNLQELDAERSAIMTGEHIFVTPDTEEQITVRLSLHG